MRYHDDGHALVVAQAAILLACACVLSYAESVLLPPTPVPGMRIGLANIAVVVALYYRGPAVAAIVAIGRVLIVGAALGTLMGPVGAMGLAGAACSWAVMSLLEAQGSRFSVLGWSVAGAAAHVVAQLLAAAIIIGSSAVITLSPLSLAMSLPTGLAVGLSARLLISRISRPGVSIAGV